MNHLLAATLWLAASAAPLPAQTAPDRAGSDQARDDVFRMTYACGGGETLDVVFLNTAGGGSYAVLLDAGELVPMQVAVSASGARYTALAPDDSRELWTKGDMADLYATTGGKEERVKQDCKTAR